MNAAESLPDLLADRLPLLVVDDDESVIQVTRLVLSRFRFEGKGLEILEARSASEARALLNQRPDIAVILLDVVMETDDAGLRLVETIRNDLKNHTTRILLRTGQAGYAPEHEVIQNYDINDYLSKADVTQNRLFFSLTTALRGYRDILTAEYLGSRVAQADKASLAKTQFLAHMSHEIRTPLNGLLGTVQLLSDTKMSDEQQQLIKDLDYTTEALLGIVNDVLDVSKIEAGKLELNIASFAVNELIEKVSAIFSANMQQKNIRFYSDVAPAADVCVAGDSLRIQQILMNFLSNAYKFTPEGGEVSIRVSRSEDDHSLYFQVQDNGIGISADRVAQVFDAYEQESAATAGQFGGTGLGLSLCRSLSHLMGGEVGVSSDEGQGSCFWLSLPLTAASEVLACSDQKRTLMSAKIALCEDDVTSRKVLTRLLEKRGVQVTAYENGQQLLDDNQYLASDALILDCHMPVKDGFTTSREVRDQGYQKPVIALTAGVTEGERQICFDSGMDLVLAKPVDANKLFDTLSQLLADQKETAE